MEAFTTQNNPEDLQSYIDEKFTLSELLSEWKNPQSEFYFAKNKIQILGYLKINIGSAQTELKAESSLEIERIYVLETFQGQKVGFHLMQKALAIAQQMQADFIWLGVWEHNSKAINFYQKIGFKIFDQHKFILGDDIQTDLMMRLEVKQ